VFRGYGPATIGLTGVLALGVAAAQALAGEPETGPYFAAWIATAIACFALIGAETVTRSRRLHSGLADEMIHAAAEQFLPAGAAGALIALVLARFEPEALWMLPGLWAILVGLGVFSSARVLPPSVGLAGGWYVLSGLVCLAVAGDGHELSPWLMGVPFGVGQLLLAVLLQRELGGAYGDG
jgi:hypothetical protein